MSKSSKRLLKGRGGILWVCGFIVVFNYFSENALALFFVTSQNWICISAWGLQILEVVSVAIKHLFPMSESFLLGFFYLLSSSLLTLKSKRYVFILSFQDNSEKFQFSGSLLARMLPVFYIVLLQIARRKTKQTKPLFLFFSTNFFLYLILSELLLSVRAFYAACVLHW